MLLGATTSDPNRKRPKRNNGDGNSPREPVPAAEWERIVTGPVTEYRDMALAKIAGHLLRRWVDDSVALSLIKSWNSNHCVPPLTDDKVLRIFERIADKEAQRVNERSAK
jgi:hypothetical protein